MWKKIPARTRGVVAVAANVSAIASLLISLATESESVSSVLIQAATHIGWACVAGIGAGALTFGGQWFLTHGFNRMIPQKRFMNMASELDSILWEEIGDGGLFSLHSKDPYRLHEHAKRCEAMKRELEKLGIIVPAVPSENEPRQLWARFIGEIGSLAGRGDLKQARRWPPF